MHARWSVPLSLLMLVVAVALVCPGSEEPDTEPGSTAAAPSDAYHPRDEEVFTDGDAALTITGRVLGPSGAPLGGAEVALSASSEEAEFDEHCPHCGEPWIQCEASAGFEHVAKAWSARPLEPLRTTTTASDGSFSFGGLRRVSFAVWARSEGLGEAVRERAAPGDPVELRLTAQRWLKGRVIDEEGTPVSGARVFARSRVPARYQATTDGRGEFVLPVGDGPFYVVADAAEHLAGGQHAHSPGGEPLSLVIPRERHLEVVVLHDGKPVDAAVRVVADHLEASAKTRDGLARISALPADTVTVYASAGELAATAVVTLRELRTRAELVLRSGGSLAVTLTDAAGEPVPSPRVRLSLGEERVFDVLAATGERVVTGILPTGSYQLLVEAEGFTPRELPVEIEPGERSLEVMLQSGALLRGRVVDEYGRPANGVAVNVSPTGEGVTTGADGRFSLTVPMPGLYELNVHHSDWGGTELKVTAPAEGLELSLLPKASLRAHIASEGEPVEGATLVMRNGANVFYSDRPSGAEGVALMRGLPPGDYFVRALHPERLPSAFQRVKLEEGLTEELQFELAPGGRLRGRVVDETGRGISGATLQVAPRQAEAATSGADGSFSLGPLRPGGSYRLEALHTDYVGPDGPLTVKPGPEPIELVMRSKGRFTGRVVSRGGGPVPRFTIDKTPVASPDGRFEVRLSADEGTVSFVVEAPDHLITNLTLPARADLGTVELELAPRLVGKVVDSSGGPVAGAQVFCDGCPAAVMTLEDGRFQLAASGDEEFEVVGEKGSQAGTVRVRPGRPATLVLRDGARARVRLFGEDGAPLAGMAIEATDRVTNTSRVIVTGEDGSGVVSLPPGQYRFEYDQRLPSTFLRVDQSTQELLLGGVPGRGSVLIQLNGYTPAVWLVPGRVETVTDPETQFASLPRAYVVAHARNQVRFSGLAPGEYTAVMVPAYNPNAQLKLATVSVGAGPLTISFR